MGMPDNDAGTRSETQIIVDPGTKLSVGEVVFLFAILEPVADDVSHANALPSPALLRTASLVAWCG